MTELKPQSRNILRLQAFYRHWFSVHDALPCFEAHQAELSWIEPELAVFQIEKTQPRLISAGENCRALLFEDLQNGRTQITENLAAFLEQATAKNALHYGLLSHHSSGDYKLLEIAAAPFVDKSDKNILVVMAEPLFSPHTLFAHAFDALLEGVIFFYPSRHQQKDPETLVAAYMNETAATLLKGVRSAMIGKPAGEMLRTQLGHKAEHLLKKALIGLEVSLNITLEQPDGPAQWRKLSLKPMLGGIIASIRDVSDLKTLQNQNLQAEDSLYTQHEFYRKLVESSADLICRYTLDGTLTFANPAFAKLHNMPSAQMVGKSLYDILQPAEAEQLRLQISQFNAGHSRTEYEQGIRGENSRRRRIHWQDHAIFDSQGKVLEVQSVGRDISHVNHRQIALRRLSALAIRSKSIAETPLTQVLTIGLDLFQMDNGIVAQFENQAFSLIACKGAGTPEVGAAVSMQQTICQRMAEKNEAIAFNSRQQARLIGIEDSFTPGYQSFIGAPVFVSGKLFGTINFKSVKPMRAFTEEDISFVKLLASFVSLSLEREGQQKIIDARNKHFQLLFRDAPVMLQTVDRHGILKSVSGAWAQMMGYDDPQEVPLGSPVNDFIDPAQAMPFPFTRVDNNARKHWDGETFQWLCRDGSRFEGEVSSICFDDPITSKPLFLMVITDVTVRNMAMAELQDANLSLADVNEKLRSFAYIASHDLQEPLRKLRSFSGHLRAELDGTLSEEAEFCLHAIERSAQRLSNMVSDLLTYSRENNRELSLQHIDFDELLATVIQDLPIHEQGENFKIFVEGTLGIIAADVNAVRHLLQNILQNAVKYRDYNKQSMLQIRIKTQAAGKIIEFEDNGIGFDANYKDKIFQPFLRLHGKSDRPGSGIGLAICKTVADRHGWTISALGIPNQGAVFSLKIPNS